MSECKPKDGHEYYIKHITTDRIYTMDCDCSVDGKTFWVTPFGSEQLLSTEVILAPVPDYALWQETVAAFEAMHRGFQLSNSDDVKTERKAAATLAKIKALGGE